MAHLTLERVAAEETRESIDFYARVSIIRATLSQKPGQHLEHVPKIIRRRGMWQKTQNSFLKV